MVLATANYVIFVMDETAVPLTLYGRKGNVLRADETLKDTFTENVTLEQTKAVITLIATLCSDPGLQKIIKQILLPKSKPTKDGESKTSTWPKHGMPEKPDNVEIWTEFSGWTTAAVMKKYMGQLKAIVNKHRPHHRIVLAYDPHPAHIEKSVLRYAARFFGFIVVFPGQLGYLFDMLDTKVFNVFKNDVHAEAMTKKLAMPAGKLTMQDWARTLYGSINKMLVNADYSSEFAKHGLGNVSVKDLREDIQDLVKEAVLPETRKPSEPEIHQLLGMKRDIHSLLLGGTRFSSVPDVSASVVPSASSSSVVPPVAHGTRMPLLKRYKRQ